MVIGTAREMAVATLVVLVGAASSIATVLVLQSETAPIAPARTDQPLVVDTRTNERDEAFRVTLTPDFEDGYTAVSATSGVVTSVDASPSTVANTGDLVAHINDIALVAFVSDSPFHRALHGKSQGPDVRRLQSLLAELGHYQGDVDGEMGGGTLGAIQAFNLEIGLPAEVKVFDPATVLWVGAEPLPITSIEISVGDRIEPTDPILVGPSTLKSVAVREPEESPDTSTGDWLVEVEGITASYVVADGSISPADVAKLSTIVIAGTETSAFARLANPTQVQLLPASAAVIDDNGNHCVFVPTELGLYEAKPITILGGAFGLVEIQPDGGIGSVLSNPAAVGERLSCD